LCPTSIPENNNPVLTEERTHFQAREQPPTCVPVQNMNEDEVKEKWHLNVEEDDIHDVTDKNMDETEDEIEHPCAQFADNTLMSYANDLYFRKLPRIDE
jgi:hemerythrin-like domain-containing protein